MKKLTYAEQLKHPNWQRVRLEMLNAADWACTSCGSKDTTLHVHHKRYIKGRMAWEYASDELQVLCDPCHSETHQHLEVLDALIATAFETREFAALIAGFSRLHDWVEPSLIESGRELDPPTFALGFAAHILRGLEMPELVQVVQFAASLMPPDSEYAMWATYSRGNVFGERE